MKLISVSAPIAALALALALCCSCGSSDPRQRVLDERARWNVELLSWTESDEALILSTRVSGPVHAELETLTLRVEMRGAGDVPAGEAWTSIDLRSIERGEFKDVLIRLEAPGVPVEGIAIDRVLQPTPDQEPRIRELG